MFETFTGRARRAAQILAEQEARASSHDWIGTEHLLLGLIQDGDGTAVKTPVLPARHQQDRAARRKRMA